MGGRQGLSLFDGKGLPIPRIAPSLSRQGGQDASRHSLQLALPAIQSAENSSCKVFFRQGRPSRANAALPTLTSAMTRSGQYKSCFQAKTRALFSKSPATLMYGVGPKLIRATPRSASSRISFRSPDIITLTGKVVRSHISLISFLSFSPGTKKPSAPAAL